MATGNLWKLLLVGKEHLAFSIREKAFSTQHSAFSRLMLQVENLVAEGHLIGQQQLRIGETAATLPARS